MVLKGLSKDPLNLEVVHIEIYQRLSTLSDFKKGLFLKQLNNILMMILILDLNIILFAWTLCILFDQVNLVVILF